MSQYTTIVEAQGEKTIHPIVKTLTKSKAKSKTVLEILTDSAGYKYNSDYNLILNQSGNVILPNQLFECYGLITGGGIRCPKCGVPFNSNLLLLHLQGSLEHGHKLSTEKTIDYFIQEFWNWRWYGDHFEK